MQQQLVAPHGGRLMDLMATPEEAVELRDRSRGWPSWDLTPRQLCDLELLCNGGFSPLRTFLGQRDHASVCAEMRLDDGLLWPVPVVLDVTEEFAAGVGDDATVALRDAEGVMLAALRVTEAYRGDREAEAEMVYGTSDPAHPGVAHLYDRTNPVFLSGELTGVAEPAHHDFTDLRLSPAQVREEFEERGWKRIVAFQTRNPLHRAHQELTLRAVAEVDAGLLIHPVVGLTKPGDIDHYTRVRCYQAVLGRYPEGAAILSLLPLAMRMAGPREALWHAIIRRNFGCTHLIVGRDHAGPGTDGAGRPFYGPYEAQELLREHEAELGVTMLPFRAMAYVRESDSYLPEDEVPVGATVVSISGTQLRDKLASGEDLPEWFTFPEVSEQLRRRHPERGRQGLVVFFTGLSGSGKSTIANILQCKLLEQGQRTVTMLDGDLVRKHLSSELGFSREHRDLNILRIGYVASEVAKHGGVAVCAPIAPYDAVRKEVRRMAEASGGMVLVHVATPLDVCERRDRKGLYAKARAGLIDAFTGISDPYETPDDADLVIDTSAIGAAEAAELVLDHLRLEGYLEETRA